MHLDDFNASYKYEYDKPRKDRWRVPTLVDGKRRGDCEDYGLGVIYYVVANENIFKFLWLIASGRASVWYVKTWNDGGHAVIEYNGLYIDNWSKAWVSKDYMESEFAHTFYAQYHPVSVLLKLLTTQIFRAMGKLRELRK